MASFIDLSYNYLLDTSPFNFVFYKANLLI